MAGETIKTRAVCLAIRPWSSTSHITTWLTQGGCVTTVVKGAVRPKSAFLGQYDLNYTCEILYYARAQGELHALRECSPLERRDELRGDYRALALADWFRRLAMDLAPDGPDATEWLSLMEKSLDGLASPRPSAGEHLMQHLLDYERNVLKLAGLALELGEECGLFHLRGERNIPVTREIVRCLASPYEEKNMKILMDTARVIGVFYTFHLDCAPEVRRTVLRMISR